MTSEADLQVQIAAATEYEDFFVPALFRDWPWRMIEAARIEPGHRVLDVACGTGIVARTAIERVGSDGRIAGVDINAGMLSVAARLAPAIEWRRGPAEALPYPDDSFDAVVCQFGLMFFADRRQALVEMLRVLAPGGHLAVSVWERLERTPVYASEVSVLDRIAGSRAADALRAPFVLGDLDALGKLVADAGLPHAAITTYTGLARFPSVRSLLEADLRGWLPLMGVALPEDTIQTILIEAERALAEYAAPDGTLTFESPAHVVTARKPPVGSP